MKTKQATKGEGVGPAPIRLGILPRDFPHKGLTQVLAEIHTDKITRQGVNDLLGDLAAAAYDPKCHRFDYDESSNRVEVFGDAERVAMLGVDWGIPDLREPSDQQSYWDIEDFIEAGFAHSFVVGHGWNAPDATLHDARWLREYFLEALEYALDSEAGPDSLHEDFGQDYQSLEFGEEGTPAWCLVEWRFEGRSDGDWCFVLRVSGSDDSIIWLEDDAVRGKRREVRAAIKRARQANGVL